MRRVIELMTLVCIGAVVAAVLAVTRFRGRI